MKIDLEHLHFWMCAIRESENPIRTLDSFWKGQIQSKEWLIKNISKYVGKPVTIDIYGGWNGVLASMLFHAAFPVKSIRSIDIDPKCEIIANTMNKIEFMDNRFVAITGDMCDIESNADIVINTSCEHITQDQYEKWLTRINTNSIIALQSNNYKIDEHIRIANSLDTFKQQSHLNVIYMDELELPLYTRYMIIGKL